MDELKTIVSSLCQSDYLPEWILELKNNEILFSPGKNIKPCIKVDNNSVRSSYWEGLSLMRAYCERGFDNPEVDEFIITVLNESISLYGSDTEKDPYKRLDSSSAILQILLVIVLSKHIFIDNINFPLFVSIYLNGVTSWPFSLVYEMFKAKAVLIKAKPEKVFEAYKTIIENNKKKEDYENYLIVEELVLKNPYNYFNYAKEHLLNVCSKKRYFDLGAFYEYKGSYMHSEDIAYFSWLKISSKGIDELLLKNDINQFIYSENAVLNKVGLCLININFDKAESLFFDNLDLFFSKRAFYADLRCILNARGVRIFKENNHSLLIHSFNNASFGMGEGKALLTLKNHIAGIFLSHGLEVNYFDEETSDLEYVLNFDKSIYTTSVHREEDAKNIKDSIWGKDIEEALSIFHEVSNGSIFYRDTVFTAFRQYLLEFYPDTFFDYIGRFDNRFVTDLLYHYASDSNYDASILVKIVVKLIGIIDADNGYLRCIHALLFAVQKLSESIDLKALESIVYSIDYKWLSIEEYDDTKDVISTCFNENLCTYFELLAYVSQNSNKIGYLKEAIGHYVKTKSCSKLKSILAYIYPRLLSSCEEYALSLGDYIFANVVANKNLSYPLLAVSRGINEKVLDTISCRDDFLAFLSGNVEEGTDRTVLATFAEWIFRFYIFENKYESLLQIQFSEHQFSIALDCLRDANYWLEKNTMSNERLKRYGSYLRSLYSAINETNVKGFEVDQMIRAVAKTIVLSNDFEEIAWSLLLSLFKCFNHFFSDDCAKLIEKYKGTRKREVTKLLDMYFGSYEPYVTYEQTLIDVYNRVAVDAEYKKKAKEWKVSLLNKNTDLNDKLI